MMINKPRMKNGQIKTGTKFLALLAIFFLLSNCASYLSVSSANAQTQTSATPTVAQNMCKCVIFRMDDANSDFLPNVQIHVMNEFISKNQSLSLGLIMHRIDSVSPVTEKIKEGQQKGLFELDLHGWDHVDYAQLSSEDQLGTLQQADDKMDAIFGQHSQVFIPPYNKFDGDTIGVLKAVGVRIFSADTSSDKTSYFIANGKNMSKSNLVLYHLPAMSTFKSDNGNGTWIKVPIRTILTQIDSNINRYGYAVVLLHPQNFAEVKNNIFVDTVSENDINDLSSMIDSIKSKNQQIKTFAGVVGLNAAPISSPIQRAPEFNGAGIIVLVLSILLVIGFSAVQKNSLVKHKLDI
jgi:peptidoglycan/xylan/chitin deacetylase (PgdA/CDA1 family)